MRKFESRQRLRLIACLFRSANNNAEVATSSNELMKIYERLVTVNLSTRYTCVDSYLKNRIRRKLIYEHKVFTPTCSLSKLAIFIH